jgi:hypothetical protein
VNEGVNIPPRGQISLLGAKFIPGARGKVKNGPQDSKTGDASQTSDWSRKKAAASSIISSRLKNFRERKKTGLISDDVSEKPDILPTTPGDLGSKL